MGEVGFTNQPIDIGDIPQLSDEDFSRVHPNFLRVSLIGHAIWALLVIVAGIVLAFVVPERKWLPLLIMAGVLALTALFVLFTILGVKNLGYQVREHDLSYRHGILVKTVETVPFVRVQHARVTQGPIQRAFGIANLAVNSAGPDLNIAGLGFEEAERLRAVVVERAGALTEES